MATDPMYDTWAGIRSRVVDPTNRDYARYGGRGLTIESDWADGVDGFINFKTWVSKNLGSKPSSGHSIDRVDNNVGYLKGNLRYATRQEQQNNMRSNVCLTYMGQTMNIKQWCARLGLTYSAVQTRLKTYGWSVEDALGIPTDGSRTKKRAKAT